MSISLLSFSECMLTLYFNITFAFHFLHFKTFSGKVIFSLFSLSLSLLKGEKITFPLSLSLLKSEKSLFHFSRKSLKVKKVKSESDYFSRSNVWLRINSNINCVLISVFSYLLKNKLLRINLKVKHCEAP